MTKIGVVIPYFRGEKYIDKCVYSIFQSAIDSCQIYIVDNDTKGLDCTNFPSESVTIIRCNPGIGYGRAANIGAFKAISDGIEILVITNQDTIFDKYAITSLTNEISSDTFLKVHIPIIKIYEKSDIEPHFIRRVLSQTSYFEDVANGTLKNQYPVNIASAACVAMHSQVVNEIGLFDPIFHMYGEDDDFFNRLMRNNGRLSLIPNASIGHFHSLVNETQNQQKTIKYQQSISQDILRVRYNMTFIEYVWFAIKNSIRALRYRSLSDFLAQGKIHMHHLSIWRTLKSLNTESLTARMFNAVKKDRLHGI